MALKYRLTPADLVSGMLLNLFNMFRVNFEGVLAVKECREEHMRLLTKVRSCLAASALAALMVGLSPSASAAVGIGISITIAPPILPVYVQPPCPTEGYLWTPGYWSWGPAGYYWVPGVWVRPPQVGVLWTPGYWAFGGGTYLWHAGYWGPHVGFYGGVNYGVGYGGGGFTGGVWSGGLFRYNTAVVNVNTAVIHNVYVDRTVIHNTYVNNHVSFDGPGGINARPTPQEQITMRESHIPATANQYSHEQMASQNRQQWASVNQGRPMTPAMDTVNGRRYDQQGRIANGVASGHLTASETGRLENREAGLNQEIHNDRAANGGRLTPQQRQQVNQQQNNLSHSIYNDKRNGNNAQYGNNAVGDRRYNQQQRLAQGISSGQVAPAGAARTERNEQNINGQVRADRQANGGKLTPGERQQVNREQNHASREIKQEKHNEKEAPR